MREILHGVFKKNPEIFSVNTKVIFIVECCKDCKNLCPLCLKCVYLYLNIYRKRPPSCWQPFMVMFYSARAQAFSQFSMVLCDLLVGLCSSLALICPKYSVFTVSLNTDCIGTVVTFSNEFIFLVWIIVSYTVLLTVMPEIKQAI